MPKTTVKPKRATKPAKRLTARQRDRLMRALDEQERMRSRATLVVAETIRRLVEKEGVSVPEIAREMGVSRQAVYERMWLARPEAQSESG